MSIYWLPCQASVNGIGWAVMGTGSPYQCKSPFRDPLSSDRWSDGGEQHRDRGSGDLHGEKCEIQATRLNWLKESKCLKGRLSTISAFAPAPIPGWLFVTQHATPCRSHPFASESSKPTTAASIPSCSGCRSSAWRKNMKANRCPPWGGPRAGGRGGN